MACARTFTLVPPKAHRVVQIARKEPTQLRVPIDDLLTATFIARHTRFASIAAFITASGLDPRGLVDLDVRSQCLWDTFVRAASNFPNWSAMLRSAQGEWILRRMGIAIDA